MKYSVLFKNICLFIILSCTSTLIAQDEPKSLTAKFITEEIKVDGALDEAVWQSADVASDFWQYFPADSSLANYQTEIRILYNETMLYVGIRAESDGNDYVVTSLRRDYSGPRNDNVSLLFDTFNDGTNAFGFGMTPYGVRREFLVSTGGASRNSFNTAWDIKWQGNSKIYDNYYTVEMAIPFTSLKFEEGATSWRMHPYRFNVQSNEFTPWQRIPQSQLLGNLAFAGELVFEKPLGKSRTPLALIPYVNTATQKDFEADTDVDNNILVGGDAKVAIGDGLNLDLTINPDFSNVEVDAIFTNLTRFELRLPERRQFFIDNSDLFASFGNFFNEARPFFSRRIGLARDTSDNLIQNRIIGGARLSGKLNQDWRLGLLSIQTAADMPNEIASNNNTMLALQRKVAKRSNVGAFFVNREAFGEHEFLEDSEKYNRVIGADYNLASASNVWTGRFYLHKSLQPDDKKGNYSSQATVTYNANNYVFAIEATHVDTDFQADLGFVPRTDIFKAGAFAQRFFTPKKRDVITRFQGEILYINYWKPTADFKFTDYLVNTEWRADFTNQTQITASYIHNYIYLTDEFDPTGTDDAVPLPADIGYNFDAFTLNYRSSPVKMFTYQGRATVGTFYNGNRYSAGGELAYRVQPWARFALMLNYDGLRLPDPHSDADLWLVTPRIDVTFTKSIFWSTLVQYSNQRDNLGINSRLQWRFAPLSDLFLVYNDNYFTQDFGPRFRSVNLKLSYWLNI